MGQPDGGWYDETPPKVVSATPADRETGVKTQKISINFNEYIKVENASSNVVVSPPQLLPPEIAASGKRIKVELKDSLKPNTTYTIDFSGSITDNNESNPMGNYTYTFSTGEAIDTLEVSGYVLDASNLEPVKGILVGLYDDLSDSAFTTKPLQRVSRTDSRGRFTVKGVAPGAYRAYALQDMDGNYSYTQKSETLAFSPETFSPTCRPDTRQDTIWRDSLHIDTIIRVSYIHHYPDDVTLMAFTALQTDRYLVKTERQEPDKLGVFFSYGHEELPQMRGLDFNSDSAFIVEPSENNDTIYYWLRDTALVNRDTLTVELAYHATDTLGQLTSRTDTVQFLAKVSYESRMKQKEKEREEWEKEQEKAKKNDEPYDTVMPPTPLVFAMRTPSTMNPDENVIIEMPKPLARCDTSALHLYSKHDTLWYRSRLEFERIEGQLRQYIIRAEWRPGIEYSLEIDSAAFEDIYGLTSNAFKTGLKVRDIDYFSSLSVQLSGISDTANVIVQMLASSDTPKKTATAMGGTANFFFVNPGTYYLRAIVDTNGNGKWDTGDYSQGRQAETVYYYPRAVECKEKWDVTTRWNVNATPTYRQKPMAITKQKPEQERKQRNRNANRARDLGIPYNP